MSEQTTRVDGQWKRRFGDLMACVGFGLITALFLLASFNAARDAEWSRTGNYGALALVFGSCAVLTIFRGETISGSSGWRPRAIAIIGNFAIVPLAALPLTWESGWLMVGSTVGIVAACLWMVWALATLGRGFSVFPEVRVLVTHGPYAIVRHPVYTASFVVYLLVALPRLSPVALIIAVLGIAAEIMRAKNEERMFGIAMPMYHDYADHVPQFFPTQRTESSPEMPAATLEHQKDSDVLAA